MPRYKILPINAYECGKIDLSNILKEQTCCDEKGILQKILKTDEDILQAIGGAIISITSFSTPTTGPYERGVDTLADVTFNWALSGEPTAQAISPTVGNIADLTARTTTLTGANLSDTTTYTLTVDGNGGPKSKSVTIKFLDAAYYGMSPDPLATVTENDVVNAGNKILTDHTFTGTINLTDDYAIIAYPASLGALVDILDGSGISDIGGWEHKTLNVTTPLGIVSYYVYTTIYPMSIGYTYPFTAVLP